jgi:hypothetical protein
VLTSRFYNDLGELGGRFETLQNASEACVILGFRHLQGPRGYGAFVVKLPQRFLWPSPIIELPAAWLFSHL